MKNTICIYIYFILIQCSKNIVLFIYCQVCLHDRKLYRHSRYFDNDVIRSHSIILFYADTSASLAPVTVTLTIPSNGWILSARSPGSPLFLFKHLLAASHVSWVTPARVISWCLKTSHYTFDCFLIQRNLFFIYNISPIILFIDLKETDKTNGHKNNRINKIFNWFFWCTKNNMNMDKLFR